MKHSITRQQMEVFAQLLEAVKQQQILATDEFDDLHSQFHGQDASGVRWTIGIHSRTWNRREQGRWVAGVPPEELQMDAGTATALWELLSKQWAAKTPPPPPPPPPVENADCNRCGAKLPPGTRFCPACGNPVVADSSAPAAPAARRCARCGHLVAAGKKFCTKCGSPF